MSDSHISRRSFLRSTARALSALSAGALVACSNRTERAATTGTQVKKVTVQHQWILDAALAGMYFAQDNNFYRDEGLEVDLIPGGPGVDPVVPVTSGAALVGIHTNASSVILPKAAGAPLRVIAAQYQRSPLGFLAKASSGIASVRDFRGKRIGTVQSSLSVVEAVLKMHRLEGQAEPVVISPTNSAQVLQEGRIDLLVGFRGNQGVQLELQGIPVVFFYLDDLGYRQESYPFFVSQASLSQNGATLRSFLAATRRGWEEVMKNPDIGAELTVKRNPTGSELPAAKALVDESIRLMNSDVTRQHGLFYMDRATWEVTNRLLVDTKLTDSLVNLDDLLTWEFLK